MCCVMPPASVVTTDVLRIASSRVVFAVVDVAHDRDDRRARLERLLGVLVRLRLVVVARVLDRDLACKLGSDQLDLVVGERLRGRLHRAEVHQQLDDLTHRDPDRLREVAQGDTGFDGHGAGRRNGFARRPGNPLLAVARALALTGSRATGAALDDDTAPALGPPPRGLIGLFGLPFAIFSLSSVETDRKTRVDAEVLPERAVERTVCDGALETREP